MSATPKAPKGRYSREQRQEDRSEGQLKDRLVEVGWACDRLGRDLGEDLVVRIFDDGASTGLTFHVQLKSTADGDKLKAKKSQELSYSLEVKDLLHWEVSTTLVVLVVWDVRAKTGWWRPIQEMVKELDEGNKGWRKKKKVAVSVPLANGTDESGLRRLRWAVADYLLPIVPKERPMMFSLVFDTTDEGMAAARAVERAVNDGEPVTFSEGFVPGIEFPEWHRRIYGPGYVEQPIKLEIKPTGTGATTTVGVEADSPEGSASLPHIELRTIARGRKRLVLTNEHQRQPIVFRVEFTGVRANFSFQQVRPGTTVYEARSAAAFMAAAGGTGGVIRIIDPATGASLLTVSSSRVTADYDLAGMRRWLGLLDKLCEIQRKIARCGTLSLEQLEKDPAHEAYMAETLVRVLREGRREGEDVITFEVAPLEEVLPERGEFHVTGEGEARLLNLTIPLGKVRKTYLDSERFRMAYREAQAQALATGESAHVHLAGMKFVADYLDIQRGETPWTLQYDALDRLSKLTLGVGGYFSAPEARAAGASNAVLEAMLQDHKADPIAPGVYHLAHFPRSEQEDLIVLWLQTDRRGVISHDTALFLHELSDILPKHRHITVPPDWAPEVSDLGPGVVLHRGEVSDDERRWVGPVPYTAPLRTMIDCIASHLSPDLVEQAAEEGIARGMFTATDLPTLRGAA